METINPTYIVNEIVQRRRREKRALRVLWIEVKFGRREFARELRKERGRQPIVPYVLEGKSLFTDPNSIMSDINEIVEEAGVRKEIEELHSVASENGGIDLVVISRRSFRVADGSSPAVLPTWFPVCGGEEVVAEIDDLTWSSSLSLKDAEVDVLKIGELSMFLYAVDRALVNRLQKTLESRGQNGVMGLWCKIRHKETCPPSLTKRFLEEIDSRLSKIDDPRSYRPSTRPRNWTVAELLWYNGSTSTPEELPAVAKALAGAIGVKVSGNRATLAAVLGRPTNPIADASEAWYFALLVTLRCACQLTTAVAHSGGYPQFPVALLQATSQDLRRFLREAVLTLKAG